jgi:hypothetical protein
MPSKFSLLAGTTTHWQISIWSTSFGIFHLYKRNPAEECAKNLWQRTYHLNDSDLHRADIRL